MALGQLILILKWLSNYKKLGPVLQLFTAVNNKLVRVFAFAIYFHPSLIFSGKARSLPLDWSPKRGSTLVGSNLACKY